MAQCDFLIICASKYFYLLTSQTGHIGHFAPLTVSVVYISQRIATSLQLNLLLVYSPQLNMT